MGDSVINVYVSGNPTHLKENCQQDRWKEKTKIVKSGEFVAF